MIIFDKMTYLYGDIRVYHSMYVAKTIFKSNFPNNIL